MNTNIAKERISYVVKPDSITASQGDFLATHVAIKKLNILEKFDIAPDDKHFFSEEDIFNQYVLNPYNRHQFIAVYGQSGTGKSHLIRWFEAKFQNEKAENEVVLFIRRSDNTLKGTIKQLLMMPEVSEIANKEVYDRLVKATVYEDENKLKGRLYHDFINEIEHDDESKDVHLSSIKRKRLVAFLTNEVVQNHMMASEGPIERIYSKIAEHTFVDRDTIAQFEAKDFFVSPDFFEDIQQVGADPKALKMARELMADDTGEDDARTIALYLNQFLNDVVQYCAGIEAGDFRLIFQDIRKELYRIGKNLTLFIEDITSFTGVDDALLDALLVEHTGMNENDQICRISSIVGTTSNYLDHNFKDNHKDRITKFVYIPSDAFDENGIFEFIGRYLNTMSLKESEIEDWLKNKAKESDYPIHELTDGKYWDYIDIDNGKQLNLYPFTKNSIRYFYKNINKGHQTPRYIIRDIIEPVVLEAINSKASFPSDKFKVISVNTTLSMMITNQVKNIDEANRLIRFLSIWGDGDASQFEDNGIVYIASVNKNILSELKLPAVTFTSVSGNSGKQVVINTASHIERSGNNRLNNNATENPITPTSVIDLEKIERLNKATLFLTEWSNGEKIDISANVGVSATIKAAQSDISELLFSAINWQSEGISADHISKVEKTYKKNLIKLENQAKGDGLYELSANWDSVNLLLAIIRWRQIGNRKWNYQDADLDAYIVSSWISKIKKTIIELVKNQNNNSVPYIDAAIIAEIYREILTGAFTSKSLIDYDREKLFVSNTKMSATTFHSAEWKSLLSLLEQKGADEINRETIHQYFNLPQGDGGSVIVLDDLSLTHILERIKSNKLNADISNLCLTNDVKLIKDTYVFLNCILERLNKVAKAELENAKHFIDFIYECFDDDLIEEDDIEDLVTKIKVFYEEINKSQINIQMIPTDHVKNNAKQIEKSIKSIQFAYSKKDTLSILLAFSADPLADLKPLYDLLIKVKNHICELDTKLDFAKSKLGSFYSLEDYATKYKNEISILADCIKVFEEV